MIILDLQQVMYSNLAMSLKNHQNEINEELIRHMVLNTIRFNLSKFRAKYGNLVLATDCRNPWRHGIFPYYKAKRKQAKTDSLFDWARVMEIMNMLVEELRLYFPYPVINVPGAEADDIIGVLTRPQDAHIADFLAVEEPILILSADHDFVQLHKNLNISQYDPVRKKTVTTNNPQLALKEHIIRGDTGDGIPNIRSRDNCLVLGIRQNRMTEKYMNAFMAMEPEQYDSESLRNYKRNEQLIDLSFTPEQIQQDIKLTFQNESGKDRSKMFNYFITHKLKGLMENMNDF